MTPDQAGEQAGEAPEPLSPEELREVWPVLSPEERREGFRLLPTADVDDFFLALSTHDQAQLLLALPPAERRPWMRLLPPDDAADVLQSVEGEEREMLRALLDDQSRREVAALMAYAEDDAGGLMNPRFARLRPEMHADEAISYLRRQAREKRIPLHYVYVLDAGQRLQGVLSVRELLEAGPDALVRDLMRLGPVTVREDTDQEQVSRLFAEYDLVAIPVVDGDMHMKGIVTVDDIVDVVQEEATEDIQKVGGMEALGVPYFESTFGQLVRKRLGWLVILLLGSTLTASAMAYFQGVLDQATVLAIFVPMVISSGGNTGSQASTLIIRAMALGEVKLGDYWRVLLKELVVGVTLGLVLATVAFLRVVGWELLWHSYGEHYVRVAAVVAGSLIGVVLTGTLAGSMLPFILRRVGLDPASASAPFVATLVDVCGLVIYFTVATALLRGILL